MKRTWVILIFSIIVFILSFLFFIFPGYYFTNQSKNVEAASVVIQPGPGTNTDSYVFPMAPNTNYGTATFFEAGCTVPLTWSYLQFNLSSIPAGSNVSSANLELYYYGWWGGVDVAENLSLYKVLANWNELAITWNNKPADSGAAETTTSIGNSSQYGWYSFNITSLVSQWVSGSASNYGLVIKDAGGCPIVGKKFYSSDEVGNPTLRPKLTVAYSGGSSSSAAPTGTRSSSGNISSSASALISASSFNSNSINPSASGGSGQNFSKKDSIKDLIYNPENRQELIKKIKNNVTLPLAGTVAVSVIAAMIINPLLSLLFNFPLRDFFYFFFNSFLEFLGIRKRRRPWGVVYDSLSKKPISGAVVKVIEADSGRVRETRLTDSQGRFGFLVDKGKYFLSVVKSGCDFPSKKIVLNKNGSDGYFPSVYLGGNFSFKEGFLGRNIPLDAENQTAAESYLLLLRFVRFFERIRVPLLILGTVLAFANLYLFRSVLDLVIVLVYIFLWIFEIIERRKIKPYGEVKDEDGTPLDLAVVRLFRKKSNKLVATSITDKKGRFFILSPKGEFYLTASRSGYFLSTLENVHISATSPKEIKIMMKSAVKAD